VAIRMTMVGDGTMAAAPLLERLPASQREAMSTNDNSAWKR
jgi:hypothetical protein